MIRNKMLILKQCLAREFEIELDMLKNFLEIEVTHSKIAIIHFSIKIHSWYVRDIGKLECRVVGIPIDSIKY